MTDFERDHYQGGGKVKQRNPKVVALGRKVGGLVKKVVLFGLVIGGIGVFFFAIEEYQDHRQEKLARKEQVRREREIEQHYKVQAMIEAEALLNYPRTFKLEGPIQVSDFEDGKRVIVYFSGENAFGVRGETHRAIVFFDKNRNVVAVR